MYKSYIYKFVEFSVDHLLDLESVSNRRQGLVILEHIPGVILGGHYDRLRSDLEHPPLDLGITFVVVTPALS